jgi:hypothetical protein
MGRLQGVKKPGLSGFSRVLKPDVIVGKNMGAVVPGHLVKRFPASLGQNDGIGLADGGQVFFIRLPAGTKTVDVARITGMI